MKEHHKTPAKMHKKNVIACAKTTAKTRQR
nr:MAG TPA: hypothetical protein [Caudoviricetes sp.]